jgi:hypothetical protein
MKYGFLVIPFRYFHLCKISSLLCEWQYVVISGSMGEDRSDISNSPESAYTYLNRCTYVIADDKSFDGFCCNKEANYLYLKMFSTVQKFRIWPLVPNNNEQAIIVGKDTHMDSSVTSPEKMQKMFRDGPKYYMSIHTTNDDEDSTVDPVSPLSNEDALPRHILESIERLWKGGKNV